MTAQGKERLQAWSVKDYGKNLLMLLIKLPVWAVQLLLFWIPCKPNRITVYSLKQRGYSCNLKYLTEYLKDQRPGTFEILWIVKRGSDLESLKQQGIPAAMAHSWQHFAWRHRSGIVITNDEFYPMCRRRRGQKYVNVWHGGINYKKIGYEGLAFSNPVQKLIYAMNNPQPDCFLSGSRSFTRTASRSFGFPQEIFLECGLPRNDILVRGIEPGQAEAWKTGLGIAPGKRVALYAPTFRKGGNGPGAGLDFGKLRRVLGERFGGDWVVLLRQHYFVARQEEALPEGVTDVSRIEDMQMLLLCSDCLISDYSSCMWDYLLTGRPCFVYAPDLAAYREDDRSFFIPPEQWPYPMAATQPELWERIREFDAVTFQNQASRHREAFGSWDRGGSCEALARTLESYLR